MPESTIIFDPAQQQHLLDLIMAIQTGQATDEQRLELRAITKPMLRKERTSKVKDVEYFIAKRNKLIEKLQLEIKFIQREGVEPAKRQRKPTEHPGLIADDTSEE